MLPLIGFAWWVQFLSLAFNDPPYFFSITSKVFTFPCTQLHLTTDFCAFNLFFCYPPAQGSQILETCVAIPTSTHIVDFAHLSIPLLVSDLTWAMECITYFPDNCCQCIRVGTWDRSSLLSLSLSGLVARLQVLTLGS